jgi:hypothetical protein
MPGPRAFVSFQTEDQWARDFVVGQVKNDLNDVEFTDYSLHEPFDEKWKANCRARMALTKGTIVLVGEHTYQSDPVLWEIAETSRQSHYMFGIQINKDKTHPIPAGLSANNVIRWDMVQIVKWLSTWK